MSEKIGLAYVPVLHKGYQNFLGKLRAEGVRELFVVSDEILAAHDELDYLHRKDRLRALSTEEMTAALSAVTDLSIKPLTEKTVQEIKDDALIYTPREDISSFIAAQYFPQNTIEYLDIFLRWNKENVGEEKIPKTKKTAPLTQFQQRVFEGVLEEAGKSFDWWRQVGAALVKDGEIIVTLHNEHLPEEQWPNIFGDTRALFKKGVNINYVTTAHAEGAAIAEAARHGISTAGAELYVTDFPCPYCARIIAKSGIKKVYFLRGYAVLDGDELLKGEGVEIVKVDQ